MVTTRRNSDDDVPNFEAMSFAAVANALPNLTATLRTQITNDIRNGAGPSGGGGGDATPQGIHVCFVGATAGDCLEEARHFKWGLKKWVLDQIVNTDYHECSAVVNTEFVYMLLKLKSVMLISAMKATFTSISHGLQGFLASVMDTILRIVSRSNVNIKRANGLVTAVGDFLCGMGMRIPMDFGYRKSLDCNGTLTYIVAPTEIRSLRHVFGKDHKVKDWGNSFKVTSNIFHPSIPMVSQRGPLDFWRIC
ncbi:hypothetical protein Tco_1569323 [Tanacetum coccineum]